MSGQKLVHVVREREICIWGHHFGGQNNTQTNKRWEQIGSQSQRYFFGVGRYKISTSTVRNRVLHVKCHSAAKARFRPIKSEDTMAGGEMLRSQGCPVGGRILFNSCCLVYWQWPGLRDVRLEWRTQMFEIHTHCYGPGRRHWEGDEGFEGRL